MEDFEILLNAIGSKFCMIHKFDFWETYTQQQRHDLSMFIFKEMIRELEKIESK